MAETDQQKAKSERIRKHHEQSIVVIGFMGAMTFAGLVLILSNPSFILVPLTKSGEGGIDYLQTLAFMLTFVSGLSGVTVVVNFLALSFDLTEKGEERVYRMTFVLMFTVFLGFEVSLTYILNTVNLGLGFYSNEILVAISFVTTLIILASRKPITTPSVKKEDDAHEHENPDKLTDRNQP